MEEILLDIESAMSRLEAAKAARSRVPPGAALLAWYDRIEQAGGPEPAQLGSETHVSDYARRRGARSRVVVNDRFVLYYVPCADT